MTYMELQIHGGMDMKESAVLEFKETITNTFLKTVCAYANYRDGRIVFGVSDKGEVVGIPDAENLCLDIENRINDSIVPRPDYTIAVDQKTNVITLTVKEGKYKPYLYKSKAYKRNDTATIEVDRLELTQLILDGRNLSYDELECDKQDLHFTVLEKRLQETIGIQTLTDDILRTLGLYSRDHKYNNAAALLSDHNEFYGIDIGRFGKNISYILDRRIVEGSSVLSQYDEAVSMYRQYYQYEVVDGINRRKIEQIPESAFREAVANAIVHRQWNIRAHIRIEMFSDRIEITSPGGLPGGVTETDYLNSRVSILRNPILGGVFFRMRYIEQFGTGIRRIKEAYLENDQKPAFDISDSSIHVTLPVLGNKDLTADQQKVYDLLREGAEISSSQAAEITGFSKSKVTSLLKGLVSKGYAKVIGKGRGTRYVKLE